MIKKLPLFIGILILLSGCSTLDSSFMPPKGFLYTNIKAPLTTDFNEGIKNYNNAGKADIITVQYYFLGASIGDDSIKKAMRDGYIERAQYAEYEYVSSFFNIYQRTTLLIYGKEEPEKI